MVRIPRVVVPNIPHHVTQRGNRRQRVFFCDEDRRNYLDLVGVFSRIHGVKIWAYCLMDNHVHFIAVPSKAAGLVHCFQEAHQAYTRGINFREGWRGYLWQGRFASYPMDEPHLMMAMRYVEVNPLEIGLVKQAEDYPWSSARAHVAGKEDPLLSPCYLTDEIKDWSGFLREYNKKESSAVEEVMRTGRPLGSEKFVEGLERDLNRSLKRNKPGRKRQDVGGALAGQPALFPEGD